MLESSLDFDEEDFERFIEGKIKDIHRLNISKHDKNILRRSLARVSANYVKFEDSVENYLKLEKDAFLKNKYYLIFQSKN
jgi:hypothetical protein